MKLKNNEYPALYDAYDQASIKAQKRHLIATSLSLFLNFFSAAILVYPFSDPLWQQRIALAGAFLLSISTVLFWVFNARKVDQHWIFDRTAAESVKRQTWQYMMQAEPFWGRITPLEVEKKFLAELEEQAELRKAGLTDVEYVISDRVRNERLKPWADRKSMYVVGRIDDQIDFFKKRAKRFQRMDTGFFGAHILFQIAAVCAAIWLAVHSGVATASAPIRPVGVLTTAVAGLLAWRQSRRYQETADAYCHVMHKLRILREKMEGVTVEQEFLDLVRETEELLSVEQKHWETRRKS